MVYSYSQISQYLRCPRSYRYLDGRQEKETPAAMVFGRCFESALGAYFRKSRERASAALLGLSGAVSDPHRMQRTLVRELLVRLPGRVIALTDGMPTPPTSELISKYSIPWAQRDRLAMDLSFRLESMIYPQLGMRSFTKIARLVLDTFLQPQPAGIRYLQADVVESMTT